MGKLTVKEATVLRDSGVLSEKGFAAMQEKGLIAQRRHSSKQYMKTLEGNPVSPQLVFSGIGKDSYSKEMIELKEQFGYIVNNLTKERGE